MNQNTNSPLKVFVYTLLFLIISSCSKDSDLFDEYVLENTNEEIESREGDENDNTTAENEIIDDVNTSDESAKIDFGPLKAFPTAYGGGSIATGGRGGIVIHVTNLNNSGPGSLREALLTEQTRTIVFDVSGRIDLTSMIEIPLAASNFTVAGQTAPEGGITITGRPIQMGGGWSLPTQPCNNAIWRYIRFRNGSYTGVADEYLHQGFVSMGTDRLIFDHCSFSFNDDQAISMDSHWGPLRNVTVQRTLFSENATGAIVGLNGGFERGDMTFIYNLWVHDHHRSPNFNGTNRWDIINQVHFNWKPRLSRINSGPPDTNIIGNYYRPGTYTLNRSVNELLSSQRASVYTANNYHPTLSPTPQVNDHNIFSAGNDSGFFTSTQHTLLANTPTPLSAQDAYEEVTGNVGANKYLDGDGTVHTFIDSYDTERINDIINNISRDPANKSWTQPVLPKNTRPSGYDTDRDGIPDAYETIRGWSIVVPNNNAITNSEGYTQLEEYLNLVDF